MVYGITKKYAIELRGKIDYLTPPMIYFLAPNYSRAALKNENLRLAIAHAIDRDMILKNFRSEGPGEQKHAVTGPFPRRLARLVPASNGAAGNRRVEDCWAYCPEPLEYRRELSKANWEIAQRELKNIPELVLLFSNNDEDNEVACQEISRQVRECGIPIRVERCSPLEFHTGASPMAVRLISLTVANATKTTHFDWSRLFDQQSVATSGESFLGNNQDKSLVDLFDQLLQHKKYCYSAAPGPGNSQACISHGLHHSPLAIGCGGGDQPASATDATRSCGIVR